MSDPSIPEDLAMVDAAWLSEVLDVDVVEVAAGAPTGGMAICADVAVAVRHQFVSSANWFATTEAESLRDAATLQGHWTRLCAALIATEQTPLV